MENKLVDERNMIRVGDEVTVRHSGGVMGTEKVLKIYAYGDYPFVTTDSSDPECNEDLVSYAEIYAHRGMYNPGYQSVSADLDEQADTLARLRQIGVYRKHTSEHGFE